MSDEPGASNERDDDCPICRGDVSAELIELVTRAAAEPGTSMTIAEFRRRLRLSTA